MAIGERALKMSEWHSGIEFETFQLKNSPCEISQNINCVLCGLVTFVLQREKKVHRACDPKNWVVAGFAGIWVQIFDREAGIVIMIKFPEKLQNSWGRMDTEQSMVYCVCGVLSCHLSYATKVSSCQKLKNPTPVPATKALNQNCKHSSAQRHPIFRC